MTYNRDDDRYYRRELQALRDNITDTHASLSELQFRLRDADEMLSYESRLKITDARKTLHAAAVHIELAMLRLPDPVTA